MGSSSNDAAPKVADAIRAAGRQLSLEIFADMKRVFAPLLLPPPAGMTVTRDIAYGPHARHRLDVFAPAVAAAPLTVLVFVHGGGFVSGDKTEAPDAYWDNVGRFAVRNGMLGVTLNYRLAPEFGWPAGRDDVAAALDWLSANVARLGGDADCIVLLGHSAGATHVAGCVGTPAHATKLAGCICVSGIYDLAITPVNPAYFGSDAALLAARSPLAGLARSPVPLLAMCAEHDPEPVLRHTLSLLRARLEATTQLPFVAQLRGHNHFSTLLHLDTPDTTIGDEILRFVRTL